MATELGKLAEYWAQKGDTRRAQMYSGLADEERSLGGPESVAQLPMSANETTPLANSVLEVLGLSIEEVSAEYERLANKFAEIGFNHHKALRISRDALKDQIMGLISPQPEVFRGRFDIPVVAFGQIPVIDQTKMAGIASHIDGNSVKDWLQDQKAYRTPNRTYSMWMQDGARAVLRREPRLVRYHLAPDERGATVADGIGLYVAKPEVLQDNNEIWLPGSSIDLRSDLKYTPYLKANDGGMPGLLARNEGLVSGFGYASCGRI